jgi:hypothetical protein
LISSRQAAEEFRIELNLMASEAMAGRLGFRENYDESFFCSNETVSINPEAGHALVILGHAIEYLADEFIYEGGPRTGNQGQVDAIQLLIRLNRQIYMACPEVPTFTQRLHSWLHPHERASAHSEKLASGLHHGQF